MAAGPDITGTEGERLDVDVTVDSTFSNQQTQTIELRIEDGGTVVHTDTQQLTLAGGANQQITLSWPTSDGDAGLYDLFIESDQDTIQRLVQVDAPLLPSLIHRWKFEDTSTTTAVDSIGSADGTINGATYVPGIVSANALEFDGTDDSVSSLGVQDLSSGFSITFWQRSPSQSDTTIIQLRANNEMFIRRQSGFIGFNIIDGSGNNVGVDSDSTLDYSNEQFIAATWDGGTMKIYSNNSEDGSAPQDGMDSQFTEDSIGNNEVINSRHFEGVLDDVRVYDRALTSSEVSDIHNDNI